MKVLRGVSAPINVRTFLNPYLKKISVHSSQMLHSSEKTATTIKNKKIFKDENLNPSNSHSLDESQFKSKSKDNLPPNIKKFTLENETFQLTSSESFKGFPVGIVVVNISDGTTSRTHPMLLSRRSNLPAHGTLPVNM